MPRKQITLGIADDVTLDLALIEYNIKSIKNCKILFRSGNGLDLLSKLDYYKPDIIILDLYMPLLNGWETIYELKKTNYSGKIICTTTGYENNLITRLKELGVQGFARKQTNQIAKAVNEVAKGHTYYDTEFALNRNNLLKDLPLDTIEISGLEITIINLLSEGNSSKEIADKIGNLCTSTIDSYITKLLDQFQVKNRTHLISYAHVCGLIYKLDSYKNLPKLSESQITKVI